MGSPCLASMPPAEQRVDCRAVEPLTVPVCLSAMPLTLAASLEHQRRVYLPLQDWWARFNTIYAPIVLDDDGRISYGSPFGRVRVGPKR